jgi:hypothetical protein
MRVFHTRGVVGSNPIPPTTSETHLLQGASPLFSGFTAYFTAYPFLAFGIHLPMPLLALGDAIDRLSFLLWVDRTVMVHQGAQAGVPRLRSDHLERHPTASLQRNKRIPPSV